MLTRSDSALSTDITIRIMGKDGAVTPTTVAVSEAYNFGYAGRDQESVQEHIEQIRALGLPAPQQVPAIFSIPPNRITVATEQIVSGDDTYGEVEFALINTAEYGWLITIASDHTDLEVEKVNMAKAKAMCPDVIGADAWRLDEVAEQWDRCIITMWAQSDGGERIQLQHDTAGQLLAPHDLIAVLTERRGGEPPAGTVVMSGTIVGEPTPGMAAWSAQLEDPESGRRLELSYSLQRLDEEI